MDKVKLEELYLTSKLSAMDIAKSQGCSAHKVNYWLEKHKIPKRTISEAIYVRHNPSGDPFEIKTIKSKHDAELFGYGLGLYWGEGNKLNKHSLRLGNTDPKLILKFMQFLIELFGVDKDRFKFSLQIFTDINPRVAMDYWLEQLDVKESQFYKIHVTLSDSLGTYRRKSQFGVVVVYFHNKKLRDIIVGLLPR